MSNILTLSWKCFEYFLRGVGEVVLFFYEVKCVNIISCDNFTMLWCMFIFNTQKVYEIQSRKYCNSKQKVLCHKLVNLIDTPWLKQKEDDMKYHIFICFTCIHAHLGGHRETVIHGAPSPVFHSIATSEVLQCSCVWLNATPPFIVQTRD